jgi:hypothetical protein
MHIVCVTDSFLRVSRSVVSLQPSSRRHSRAVCYEVPHGASGLAWNLRARHCARARGNQCAFLMAWRVLSSATAVDLWAFGNPNPNGPMGKRHSLSGPFDKHARPEPARLEPPLSILRNQLHPRYSQLPPGESFSPPRNGTSTTCASAPRSPPQSTLHVGNKHTTWKIARRNTWRGVGGRSRDIATRRTQQHSALRGTTWAQGEAPATQPCMRRRSSARSRRSGMSSPAETGRFSSSLIGARRAFLRDNREYRQRPCPLDCATETGTSPPRRGGGGGGGVGMAGGPTPPHGGARGPPG